MKKILTSCLIVLICLTAFITGYGKGCYSYAINQDGTLTNDELDIAISSWLQSHGGNIFSPQNYRARKTYEAGLIHNFVYGDGGGYDAIRNHIEGGAGGNNELRFNFDGFIIQKLNTWLNRKLQNGEFGQGAELNEDGMFDDGIDNELYDGKYIEDANGNNSLVYIIDTPIGYEYDYTHLLQMGSPYKYTNNYLRNAESDETLTFDINNTNYSYVAKVTNVTKDSNVTVNPAFRKVNINSGSSIYARGHAFVNMVDVSSYGGSGKGFRYYNGNGAIIYSLSTNTYYVGFYSNIDYYSGGYFNGNLNNFSYLKSTFSVSGKSITFGNDDNVTNVTLNFYTNNNNNVAVFPTIDEGDTLYITPKVNVGVDGEVNYQPYIINEGDTINNVINQYYIDSNTPDKTITYPSDDPNDTGGGNNNPSGGILPNWDNPYPNLSPDGEGGFNFNFNLPDLNIDWNISGLKDKFPFSIPFDLIHFVEVLNASPETPEFDWIIDLKIYQWHIDADLHQFDNLAGIVRNVEFIGFCITLILITRRMIKG